jgi:pimeloyl-ACP methyl ester carboxylesterase
MKPIFFLSVALLLLRNASGDAPRVVDLKSTDGTILKGSYFAAAKPGPGVLLFHQSNRTRRSWDDVAPKLAAAGINTLTVDMRGHGESPGKYDDKKMPEDVDAAFNYLVSQPGVNRDVIGASGAGWLGVLESVETARRHPHGMKSLVLLSGETMREGLHFLHEASQLPELFVVSDEDEYPPTQDAMKLLYVTASSPMKKLIHYSAAEDARWLWYETSDAKVPAHGGHGTDLFKGHPDLPGIIVNWFVTTLIKTPGHAPADTVACATVINQLQEPAGIELVARQLTEARKTDPQAQLFPEISASIVGQDYMRDGGAKSAIEVFKLILLAYPDSADDNDNLASAYLKDGQKDLARQHAEKALSILDAHAGPASSWTDTEEYRGEIREDAKKTLKQLAEQQPH